VSTEVLMTLQAMQYASPKALWNLIFGMNSPSFEPNEGNSQPKNSPV